MPVLTIRSQSCLWLIAGVSFAIVGCSVSHQAKTYVAHGKVRFKKDQIPVGALVVFHPKDPKIEKEIGGKPFGKVEDDGTFVLTTYALNDGAPEGEYGVTIDWRPKPASSKMSLSSEGGPSVAMLSTRSSPIRENRFNSSLSNQAETIALSSISSKTTPPPRNGFSRGGRRFKSRSDHSRWVIR